MISVAVLLLVTHINSSSERASACEAKAGDDIGDSPKPSPSTNKALAVGIGVYDEHNSGWDKHDSSFVDMIVSSNNGPKVDGYKAPRDVALRSGTMYRDGVQVDPGTRVEEKDVLSMEAAVDRAIDRIEQRLNADKGNGNGNGNGNGKVVEDLVNVAASAHGGAQPTFSSLIAVSTQLHSAVSGRV